MCVCVCDGYVNVSERDTAERKEGRCCWIKDRRITNMAAKGQQSHFDNFGFNPYWVVRIGFH